MHFVRCYRDGRTCQVRIGCLSNSYGQDNGLVKCGVISTILFNIQINNTFEHTPENPICAVFADDCSVWVQGRGGTGVMQLVEQMQQALDHVSRY